jgi:hypothetical protein
MQNVVMLNVALCITIKIYIFFIMTLDAECCDAKCMVFIAMLTVTVSITIKNAILRKTTLDEEFSCSVSFIVSDCQVFYLNAECH